MAEPINIEALQHSLDHMRVDHETVVKAFDVAAQLTDWVNDRCQSTFPGVHVSVAKEWVSVSIGQFVVWDSEENGDDELNINDCLSEYCSEVMALNEPFENHAE